MYYYYYFTHLTYWEPTVAYKLYGTISLGKRGIGKGSGYFASRGKIVFFHCLGLVGVRVRGRVRAILAQEENSV